MKTLKSKIIAGMTAFGFLFGVLFIAGAMEDKSENKTKKVVVLEKALLTTMWFEYIGPAFGTPNYDPMDPENYTAQGTSEPNCEGENQVCGLHAEGEPSAINPAKTVPTTASLSALQNDIENKNPVEDQLTFRN